MCASGPRPTPILDPPIRLAVCASGGGTTLQNLLDQIADGCLTASVVQLVASRPGIGAIARAERAGIPVAVEPRGKRSLAEFSEAIFTPIRSQKADLVILGGFLALVDIPDDYAGKVLNIHPSLIPAFCGKGFHGETVHRAAIEAGVKVSGCTVHFADATYDTGPIILQRPVPVHDDDTPASLAARVFTAECEALPEAIRLYATDRLEVNGRLVTIRPDPQRARRSYRDDPASVGSHFDLGPFGPHHAPFRVALEAIHAVHGNGGLPAIRGLHDPDLKPGTIGEYRGTKGTSVTAIALDARSPQAAFTATHEIGHFLDQHAFGNGYEMGSTGQEPFLTDLMYAIFTSPEGRALTREFSVKKHRDSAYLRYAADPTERFARAYAQYIVQMSASPILAEGLRLEKRTRYGKLEHWSEESFAPIAVRFDEVLREKGWNHE